MNENILCENEEYLLFTGFLEEVSDLLRDSDDKEEKERIRKCLQEMTDTTAYMIIGDEGAGKTSLLNIIFEDIVWARETMGGAICEYRWGEQDFETPVADGVQKRFVASDAMKGLSVIDTTGINRMGREAFEKVMGYAASCSVIFVALDVSNIRSPRIWELVEKFPAKKMVFFLTKCDLVTQEVCSANMEKVKNYMREANITAPLFAVTAMQETQLCGISTPDFVRSFLRQQVIGENPVIKKQAENVMEIQAMLRQLEVSFAQRKKQYDSDIEILGKINESLDAYILNHKQTITKLTEKLAAEINKDIDSYEAEIISKMDPYKIKERFGTKDDFIAYLDMVNDNYKAMMNDSVNRKTIGAMKECLHDLETVFQEAVGYFNERETILEVKDRFYGTMSQSRRQISVEAKETALMAGEFYRTLSDASEELFSAIWREREQYDRNIHTREILSKMMGGGVGTAGGAASAFALGAHLGAHLGGGAGMLFGAMAFIPMIGIGMIVGAAVINTIVQTIYDPKAAAKMEKNAQECILKFKAEVDKTREIMVREVTDQVRALFEKELDFIDGSFTDFRLSVNIEGEKLPLLQKQIEKAKALSARIGQIAEERKIEN